MPPVEPAGANDAPDVCLISDGEEDRVWRQTNPFLMVMLYC